MKKASTDWRAQTMAHVRTLIKQADPKVAVEMKYKKKSNPKGIPVWYHDGMICTGETYKDHLRLTFSKGKSLKDPKKLLTFRGFLIYKGDKIPEKAFKDLIKEAVAVNQKGK